MPKLPKGELSRTEKGYRVSVGYYDKEGKKTPKVFWLGHDEEHAQYLAFTYRKAWNGLLSQGRYRWTPDDLTGLKQFIDDGIQFVREAVQRVQVRREELERQEQVTNALAGAVVPGAAKATVRNTPAAAGTDTTTATLYKAVDAYLEHLKGKRKSDKHKHRCEQVLRVNLKHVRKDCPLSEIDYLWIDRLCDHFKSRPANQKDGKTPLAPASVKGILTYLRLFFIWVDDVEYGGWQAPRKMLKCFKVRLADLMTPKELREAGTIKQFDTATLGKLYASASPFQRSIMLAALFSGATQ